MGRCRGHCRGTGCDKEKGTFELLTPKPACYMRKAVSHGSRVSGVGGHIKFLRTQGSLARGSWLLILSATPSALPGLTPYASSCASSSFSSSLLPCCLWVCAWPSCLHHSQSLSCQSQMTSCLYVSFSSFLSFFF